MRAIDKEYYPAWTEINLANIENNFKQLRKRAGAGMKMLIAVKADAYGHGMVEVSRRLAACGADYLGVASVNEALILRKNKIKSPILVLGSVYDPGQVRQALDNNISLTVAGLKGAELFNKIASSKNKLTVHIKIDTGMGRIGIWYENAFFEICRIRKMKNLDIQGIFTHFPSADSDLDFTRRQLKIFKTLIRRLKDAGMNIPMAHASNSIALSRLKAADIDFLNMSRPGIMVYGMYPAKPGKADKSLNLKPALELKSRVVFIKKVSAGQTISYGRTHTISRPTRVSTISIGYADGYPRCLSNRGYVKIRGDLYPVVGRVCMDQTMVDIGIDSKIRVGDEVILIGDEKKLPLSAENIAALCETIPYEITCGISSRVGRVFKKD